MAEVHILNVGQGSCAIIKSNSGHVTMIDICNGNAPSEESVIKSTAGVKGNFRMNENLTNPVTYLRDVMGEEEVFRFILSHPDMDHMDGLDNLFSEFKVRNFWDSGVRKEKPDFSDSGSSRYKEDDWDKYENIIVQKEATKVVAFHAGDKQKYFNLDDNNEGGDYLSILAPTPDLVKQANDGGDINDASYVIAYRSSGGVMLFPGDAHDKTWEYVIGKYLPLVKECVFMVAPHHGRDSDRDWKFLDMISPKFSLLGCADSKDLAYQAWNSRELDKMTQNQSGNVVLYPQNDITTVYIENASYARSSGGDCEKKDSYGNVLLGYLRATAEK